MNQKKDIFIMCPYCGELFTKEAGEKLLDEHRTKKPLDNWPFMRRKEMKKWNLK